MRYLSLLVYPLLLTVLCTCGRAQNKDENQVESAPIFSKLDSLTTGIDFANRLTETDSLNYFTYTYMYMGGGISAGDVNGDGLVDLYFTGNMVGNELYLNRGDLKFEKVTAAAGVGGDDRWYTGTTMVDVNNDGRLDIYLSVAGQDGNKANQLFINKGADAGAVPVFEESATAYGLADEGNSVTATFFDYDRDGDLDCFVANYPITATSTTTYGYFQNRVNAAHEQSDHLYRNDGGRFTDVTREAGLIDHILSMSATAADVNQDGWTDLYVSSDFDTPDQFYLNNGDGTFREVVEAATGHTSFYGMGVDIADYNNDGQLDIFQVDMDAALNRRSKASMANMNPELFQHLKQAGFNMQYMQNSLQLWTGQDPDGTPRYAEVSRMAGVSSTDWSWGGLFADFDNDGFKDLVVSNGTRREINNKDYFKNLEGEKRHPDSLLKRSLAIPSEPIDNFIFRNNGDLTFRKANQEWGFSHVGFSNGVVYADLDNDGDLEIVTNNLDEGISFFENTAAAAAAHLTISLEGPEENVLGLGTKVKLELADGSQQYQELAVGRGFQSSVPPLLYFGLGNATGVARLTVTWPDGKAQTLTDLPANDRLVLRYAEAEAVSPAPAPTDLPFAAAGNDVVKYAHKENEYDDFAKERLLPHKTSAFGPGMSTGDLNGDGLEDIYIGAATSYPGGLFYQRPDGSFEQQKDKWLLADRNHEDLGSIIFDADGDGDQDLYVVSGGNEFTPNSRGYQDRLYVNTGGGKMQRDASALPVIKSSGGRVVALDFDKDGDLDLLVTGRLMPNNYPYPADSYLLENQSTPGKPKFADVTNARAPMLRGAGLVTTAAVGDYDGDGWDDVMIAGEWMSPTLLNNNEGTFETGILPELTEATGWWFSLTAADFDADGDLDLIAGNLGENYKYQASGDETFDVFLNDFDGNRTNDIVLSYYNEGEQYPVRGRQCSSEQMPDIARKFKTYDEFSTAKITDVYEKDKLEGGIHYQVKTFASYYLENDGGNFSMRRLPQMAQTAPINQTITGDFNADGHLDAVVAGNLYQSEVETPRADAGHGLLLAGDGKGGFTAVAAPQSGLFLNGDVKDMVRLRVKDDNYIVAARNNDLLEFVRVRAGSASK